MTEQAITPLRRRMIEDMTIRSSRRRLNMTRCDGSRSSRAISSDPPIQPNQKMYAAFSCI